MNKSINNRVLISKVSSKFPKLWKSLLAVFVVCLATVSYFQYSEWKIKYVNLSDVFANRISTRPANTKVIYRFDDFVGFSGWDKMCIVKPYSVSKEIYQKCGVDYHAESNDTRWTIILMNAGKIVKEITIDYSVVDAVDIETVESIDRQKSFFILSKYKYANTFAKSVVFEKRN